jgi:hypothetical protein
LDGQGNEQKALIAGFLLSAFCSTCASIIFFWWVDELFFLVGFLPTACSDGWWLMAGAGLF